MRWSGSARAERRWGFGVVLAASVTAGACGGGSGTGGQGGATGGDGGAVALDAAPPPTNPADNICTVTDVAGGPLCAGGSACPVDFDTAINCGQDEVDSLRIAPGAGGTTYVTFGVVPVNRTTRALIVDHTATSVFAATSAISSETLFVLPSEAGDLRLGTEVGSFGVGFAWWNGSAWITSSVPDAMALYFFDGAVAADGTTSILYGVSSPTHDPIVLGTCSPAGGWSRQQLAEDGSNGGVTLDPSVGPLTATWEGATAPALTVRAAGRETVLPAAYPTSEAQLSLRVTLADPPGSASPVVAAETDSGGQLFVFGAAGYTAEAPPTPVPSPPLTCAANWANGCQPSSCSVQQDSLVPESVAVAADTTGGVWAAYLWRHVDVDYTVAVGHESCPMTMVADHSSLTLYVARVAPDGSSAPEVRWRAAVDVSFGQTAITLVDDWVVIGLLSNQTPLGGTSIRLLSLSKAGLDSLPAVAP